MTRKLRSRLAAAIAGAGTAALLAGGAHAEGWDSTITLYAFTPAIDSTITGQGGATVDTSASIGDVLDKLKMAFMAAGEFHKDRYSILFDLFYSNLGTSGTLSGPLSTFVNADLKMTMFTVALGYDLVRNDQQMAQVYGGIRNVTFDSDVFLTGGGPIGAGFALDRNDSFWQPLIGIRGRTALDERWSLSGFASIGGYFDGSNNTYDIYGGVNYAFSERVEGNFGYRYLAIDFEANTATVDLNLSGPLLGVSFKF